MAKIIHQKVTFNASAHDVYELIMEAKKHAGFTGEHASVSREVGGEFSVWGGYATGKNLELKQDKKIVQTWRASDWPEDAESKVTFELKDTGENTCELTFSQTDVPEEFYDDIEQGWQDNYWQLMKDYLEK